jgi:HSP20 family protein
MNMRDLVPWSKNRELETRREAPMTSLLSLHREMNRMFDDFLREIDAPGRIGTAWPSIEVSESDDQVRVIAELPGLEERDVEVTLADGVLTLKGHKKVESNGKSYSERWEGEFARDIDVGEDIDADKVGASFKNGVLTIVLAKKPEAERQVKKIAIH